MKGRLPKPNALKAFDGNPGKRPYEEEFAPPVDPNDVPEELTADPAESAAYVKFASELAGMGLFTTLDIDWGIAYAVNRVRWTQARQDVKTNGLLITGAKGNKYRNPSLDAEAQALAVMERIMDRFGMSPSARARLKGKGGGGIDANGKGLIDQVVTGQPIEGEIKNWEPPRADVVG